MSDARVEIREHIVERMRKLYTLRKDCTDVDYQLYTARIEENRGLLYFIDDDPAYTEQTLVALQHIS